MAAEAAAPRALVVGAGPAGLVAAETLARAGVSVTLADHLAAPARKFLMAGRGGLNLTHSQPLERFLDRYGAARPGLEGPIRAFPPEALRAFAHDLDAPTFIGSSGRVFPVALKASPLLRAWLQRLADLGVTFAPRQRLTAVGPGPRLALLGPEGARSWTPDIAVLALGGGSWAKLGTDGSWAALLRAAGVPVADLRAANCGFDADWSAPFRDRFAGQPVKRVGLAIGSRRIVSEIMLTRRGVEGTGIYALSASLSDAIAREGRARLHVDLLPDLDRDDLARRLARDRGKRSLSTHLRKVASLAPAAIGLARETAAARGLDLSGMAAAELAAHLKNAVLDLVAAGPIDLAISTAGGVRWEGVTPDFELKALPGVFVAGEMLDFDAPTGGYLLQAAFATGIAAARGALARIGAGVKAGAPID